LESTSVGIATNIILPAYNEYVGEGRIYDSQRLFDSNRGLSPNKPEINRYLAEIEIQMLEQDDGATDFAPLLQSIYETALKEPKRIQANYLLLVNSIVNRLDGIAEGKKPDTYDDLYAKLERAINANNARNIDSDTLLVNLMNKPALNKTRACKLLKLIHPGGDANSPG
jgi:hypothetical protein